MEPEDFLRLLTGVAHPQGVSSNAHISAILDGMWTQSPPPGSMDYEQIHAALLGIDISPMGRGFFAYWEQLVSNCGSSQEALRLWRKDAVAAYGDVRRAYEDIRLAEPEVISAVLGYPRAWPRSSSSLFDQIRDIPVLQRPLLGYLSTDEIRDDLPAARRGVFDADVEKVRALGTENTYAYILAPALDVYVATSMRRTEEFFDIARFCEELFEDRFEVRSVDYFDPTRTFLEDRIEKGIAEGLMLRRAQATIYLVQLSDTLGKDSELASTLAQGKPVIAFVPHIDDLAAYAERILAESVAYASMLGIWSGNAEDLSTMPSRRLRLRLRELGQAPRGRPGVETLAYKIAEEAKKLLNRRASTLGEKHPLGLQIDMNRGTANGVLVARDLDTCAEVLIRSLTNTLEFDLRPFDDNDMDDIDAPVGTGRRLVERLTGSTHRVALSDSVLSRAMRDEYGEADAKRRNVASASSLHPRAKWM